MPGVLRKLAAKVRQKGLAGCLRGVGARLRDRGIRLVQRLRRVRAFVVVGLVYLYYWSRAAWFRLVGALRQAGATVIDRTARTAARLSAPLLARAGVRFLDVCLPRLGHLACEVDCYVKEERLGRRPRQRGVILAPPAVPVANRCLLDYWSRYVRVVRSPGWCRFLTPFAAHPRLRFSVHDYVAVVNGTAQCPAIQAAYAGPPLLRLTDAHRARGEA